MQTQTRPLTLEEIETLLWQLQVELESLTNGAVTVDGEIDPPGLERLEHDNAKAESDYNRKWLTAYARSSGKSSRDRELTAKADAVDEFETWKLVEARHRATVEKVRSLRDRIGALQTMAANTRSQI